MLADVADGDAFQHIKKRALDASRGTGWLLEELFVGGSDGVDGLGSVSAEFGEQLFDRLVVSAGDLLGVVGVHVESGASALGDVVSGGSLLGSLDQAGVGPLDRGDVGQQLSRVPTLLVDRLARRLLPADGRRLPGTLRCPAGVRRSALHGWRCS